MKNKPCRIFRCSQFGFSLVELLVGLAIGMLMTLVILQAMTTFENQTRATTGTADAQTNGAIALYSIGREMQMAGFSLLPVTTSGSPLSCTTGTPLAPVLITNGVAATGIPASDTITLRYGNSAKGGVPGQIYSVSATSPYTVSLVTSNLGCRDSDNALIINGTACTMATVDTVSTSTLTDLTLTQPPTNTGATAGAYLACLGSFSTVTFAVNNGRLERNGTPLLDGIVNLQAQYGVANSAASNTITAWVEPTTVGVPASSTDWGATMSVANRNRIKAVRLAIVARNAKPGPAGTTTACSSTTTTEPSGLCAWEGSTTEPAPTVDLSPGDTAWARYRYRVFETVMPLRNVIWSKDAL